MPGTGFGYTLGHLSRGPREVLGTSKCTITQNSLGLGWRKMRSYWRMLGALPGQSRCYHWSLFTKGRGGAWVVAQELNSLTGFNWGEYILVPPVPTQWSWKLDDDEGCQDLRFPSIWGDLTKTETCSLGFPGASPKLSKPPDVSPFFQILTLPIAQPVLSEKCLWGKFNFLF